MGRNVFSPSCERSGEEEEYGEEGMVRGNGKDKSKKKKQEDEKLITRSGVERKQFWDCVILGHDAASLVLGSRRFEGT